MLNQINDFFGIFVGFLEPILFMQLNGFPLIVLVLLSGALIFTLYFRFINVRGFMHSIDIIKGKYDIGFGILSPSKSISGIGGDS